MTNQFELSREIIQQTLLHAQGELRRMIGVSTYPLKETFKSRVISEATEHHLSRVMRRPDVYNAKSDNEPDVMFPCGPLEIKVASGTACIPKWRGSKFSKRKDSHYLLVYRDAQSDDRFFVVLAKLHEALWSTKEGVYGDTIDFRKLVEHDCIIEVLWGRIEHGLAYMEPLGGCNLFDDQGIAALQTQLQNISDNTFGLGKIPVKVYGQQAAAHYY
jgi:hypothetical protein